MISCHYDAEAVYFNYTFSAPRALMCKMNFTHHGLMIVNEIIVNLPNTSVFFLTQNV